MAARKGDMNMYKCGEWIRIKEDVIAIICKIPPCADSHKIDEDII